jgi:uncharacterized protein YukE
MSGFQADPAALEALALRLADTSEEFAEAAADLETAASGDLGPPAVTGALAALTGEWSTRIRTVQNDYATTAANVQAAAKAYRATDASAIEELGRVDG